MARLFLRLFRLLIVRLVRGIGYRGPRPGLVGTVLALVLLGVDLALAGWLRSSVAGHLADAALPTGLLGAAVMNMVFFMTGPALLLTESIRDRGSRLHMVLATLPLTLREIAIGTWLPAFASAVFLLGLLGLPAVAVLAGAGLPSAGAVRAVAAALLAGIGLGALVIVAGRWIMRGGKWAGARFPTMLLLWILLCAVQTWQVGHTIQTGRPAPWSIGLLLPALADEMTGQRDVRITTLVWLAVIAACTVALVPWSARATATARLPTALWRWRGSRWPALTTLELTRFVRSGLIVANAVAAQVAVVALTAAVLRVEPRLQVALAPYLVAAVMNLNAVPLLLVRGQTQSRWPVPLVLGWSPLRWVCGHIGAALAIFLVLAPVPMALLASGEATAGRIIAAALPSGVLAFGLAMAVAWAMPAGPDNPLGQIAATLVILVLYPAVFGAAAQWYAVGSPPWGACLVAAGLVSLAVPVLVERSRWQRVIGPAATA